MEEMMRSKVLEYRELIREAKEAGMTNKARRVESEMEGFRAALELVLSEQLLKRIFREE